MFSTIIKKIKEILVASDLFADVYNYEVEQFKGTPTAIIVPSTNESEYNTTEENVRVYAFTIRIFVSRNLKEKDVADRIMRDLVSTVIDDFDKDYTFKGIENPTGYTFINTFASPSSWGYLGAEDEYRVAEIDIRCRVSVDLNSI